MGTERAGKLNLHQPPSLHTTPLYVQLRDHMIERIRSLSWQPNRLLPNEVALAHEFGVSIGTVRKAMDDLSARGLVVRQQGRGTFVADTREAATASSLAQIRQADGSPIDWDPPHTSVTVGPANTEEKMIFGWLADATPLLRFEWVTGMRGRRMVLQKTCVPSEVAELDVKQARHVSSLGEIFGRARIFLDRTEVTMSVTPVDAESAGRLKIASGTCLQRMRLRYIDLRGRPIAISEDWLALKGEVYAYTQHRG